MRQPLTTEELRLKQAEDEVVQLIKRRKQVQTRTSPPPSPPGSPSSSSLLKKVFSQATENLQKILARTAPSAARSNKPLTSPCAPLLSTPRNKTASASCTPLALGSAAQSPSAGAGAEAPLAERLAKANKVSL